LEKYDIGNAARKISAFTDDLSRWYLRRSRTRFQRPESERDLIEASALLRELLLKLSQLIAPFAPFFGEALFKSLSFEESVHLSDWPKADKKMIDVKLSSLMAEARDIATKALAKRAESGVKVRQPLGSLRIKKSPLRGSKEIVEILKEEVNVKEIIFDETAEEDVSFDLTITPELKQEGLRREFGRMVQEMRQKAGLRPGEEIIVEMESFPAFEQAVRAGGRDLAKVISAREIDFKLSDKFDLRTETETEGEKIILGIRRI
jgi:isoleucyl-tRNA synthetase